jgi:hypothetical protein
VRKRREKAFLYFLRFLEKFNFLELFFLNFPYPFISVKFNVGPYDVVCLQVATMSCHHKSKKLKISIKNPLRGCPHGIFEQKNCREFFKSQQSSYFQINKKFCKCSIAHHQMGFHCV